MKKFTKLEPVEEIPVGGIYKRTIVVKKFQTDDGMDHEFTTFYQEGSRVGAVIAITPNGEIVTTYQFRAGPEYWMYELPGGGLKRGEDIEAGVLRELAEETGYTSDKIEFLGTCYGDAYTNVQRHYFLALNCLPGENGMDKEEADQGAEVRLITIPELIRNAQTDQMSDPAAVLMAYDRLQEIYHA